MHRRNLLKASMAFAAYTGLSASGLMAARAWAADQTADGEARPFDFNALKDQARQLAASRYVDTKQVLPQTLAQMSPLQFNAIQYDANPRCGMSWTVSWTCSFST